MQTRLERWWLLPPVAIVVAILVAPPMLEGTEEALRRGIRHTATVSAILLGMCFIASSVNALWTGGWTKWLLRNRRYLGLSFALCQAGHALLFTTLWLQYTESFFAGTSTLTLVGGGIGYVFTFAMAVTSFDATTAMLGRKAWKLLHTTGMYVLWGIFVFTYVGRFPGPLPSLLGLLLVLGLVVRIQAKRR